MKNDELPKMLKKINDKMESFANSELKSCQLTKTQGYVMGFIDMCGGSTTQKEIENFLSCSHPTVVGLVSRLEQNGFVQVSIDDSDRRNRIITHTQKALDTKNEMNQKFQKHNEILVKYLSEQEQETLISLLEKVNLGLKEAIEDKKGEKTC